MSGESEDQIRYAAKIEALSIRAREITSRYPEIDLMDAIHILANLELTPAERLGRMLERNGILKATRS